MVPQAIQSRLDDLVYETAATTNPIPLKDGVGSLGNIAPTICDDCKEFHKPNSLHCSNAR